MKAARLHAYGQPLVIDDIPVPTPGPGQVLVKIEGSGFCHSDIHVIDGEIPILPRMPLTLGHENAGRVAGTGNGVQTLKEDDPVVVFGGWGCGLCDYCVTGHEQLCPTPQWPGLSKYDGGYAEYLLVPHERYVLKLSQLAPREAAVLTDAALTPYRAVRKSLPKLQPDHDVLVIGLGGLGQYGLKLLRLMTGCRLIVVDKSADKLRLAGELGADHALNAADADLSDSIKALTNGRNVVATFDFVGSEETLALAIGVTASLGKVTQVGLAGGTAKMKVLENTPFEVEFEATLWGTLKELREVLALAESGRLSPIPLEPVPLDLINDVYTRVKQGQVAGRVVMTP